VSVLVSALAKSINGKVRFTVDGETDVEEESFGILA
jgi:hypothetical protein